MANNYGEQAVKDLQNKQKRRQRQSIPTPDNGLRTQQSAAQQGMAEEPTGFERILRARDGIRSAPPASFGQMMQPVTQPMQEETPIHGVGFGDDTETGPELKHNTVDSEMLHELTQILLRYKAGKASIDRRVLSSEAWWKKRNSDRAQAETGQDDKGDFKASTSWLHNILTNKHADALEAYPTPNILPRESGDKLYAWALSHILPVIFEQNKFEAVYDKVMWSKLKFGTGVYQVTWDKEKLNGLGDISFKRANILNLFWEPGVDDIQDSRYFFNVAAEDKDLLQEQYPELNMRTLQNVITPREMPHDDSYNDSNKVEVIDCYYKKKQEGKTILHYIKYVGDTVLYATENDPQRAVTGLYEHGLYPFVFDVLFPVEDSCAGYGYVDICANAQIRIDLMNTSFVKNTMAGAQPRYFHRSDGSVNREQFLDLNETLIDVDGNLGDDSLKVVDYKPLSGNYINFLNNTIDEIRETSGNTETATGSSTSGVTAASGIAAMQEASGKLSRASTTVSHRAYAEVCYMVIELIRQYYEMPRQFRIVGDMGVQRFIQFDNRGMQPVHQGVIGEVDLGYRMPAFDVDVVPQKQSSYTKLAQNELAIQFYSLGMFNPQMTDQALAALEMMDFDGKDDIAQRISANGTMFQQLQLYKAMAATLAAKHEPELTGGLLGAEQQPLPRKKSAEKTDLDKGSGEAAQVTKARERAATAGQPGGSRV